MKKQFKIGLHLIKLNIEKDLMYSLNTWFLLFTTFVYATAFIVSLKFVFSEVDEILGFNFEELLIMVLGGQLFWYTHQVFVRKSLQNLADMIHEGGLDMYLLKPFPLRRIVPFLEFDQRHVFPALITFGVIVYFVKDYNLSALEILGMLFFFANGIVISFFLTLIFATSTFWVGRNDAIFQIIMYFVDILRLPMSFFPGFLKPLFFILPIIPMLNPSFQILLGDVDIWLLCVAIGITVILFSISEIMWRRGLKSYTSAN